MLKFEHACIGYGKETILTDINTEFQKGEITVVLGPNGCGKSTLLQSLVGASTLQKGHILLEDREYSALSSNDRAKRLAFLPQTRTHIPALPVHTLVEHGRFPYLGFGRKKSAEDTVIVREAMEAASVLPFKDDYVDTLSGGVRQRVFFALTLAQDTDIVVLDEPTTYLDPASQKEFFALLQTLKAKGKTIILILHDTAAALQHADRLLLMKDRKIAASCTPEECLKQRYLTSLYNMNIKVFSEDGRNYYFCE